MKRFIIVRRHEELEVVIAGVNSASSTDPYESLSEESAEALKDEPLTDELSSSDDDVANML